MNSNMILMIVVLVLVLGLLVWLLANARRTKVDFAPQRDDAPAQRNQALIDAPPAAVPPPVLAETGVVVPAVPLGVTAGGDDLTRLKGVGPKLADQLRAMGVTSFAQVAAWDDTEIDRVDAALGRFQGRIRRDDWPGQARLLAAGDTAGYEAKFGRL
jgi:predicted flap endonuclease-1-like 5' DNA nuclease